MLPQPHKDTETSVVQLRAALAEVLRKASDR